MTASDSQITDGARGLSYPAQKLHPFGSRAAWGGSGSRATLYDIEQIFNAEADGVVAALRVLDALDATSPSVGGPMDICSITPDGARHFTPDEVEEVRTQVSRWIELENQALDRLFN